jgi:hypothetical protein
LAVHSTMAALFASFYHGLLVLLTRGLVEYAKLLVFHAGALYIFCTNIKYIYIVESLQSHCNSLTGPVGQPFATRHEGPRFNPQRGT